MLKRTRLKLVIPIMIATFFGAMFIVNQFYPEFPQDDRLTMYIWAALISGVVSIVMFPSPEQEKIIEEGHAKEKRKREERIAQKKEAHKGQKKYPFKK